MKYNKLLLSVLCAGCITTSVMADAEIKIEDKKITVTCDALQGKSAAMTAVRKNHKATENEWVVAVKESTGKNGKAVFTFNMPDLLNDESVDGEYVIYTKTADLKETTEFLYVSPETVERISGLFAGVTSSDDLVDIFADEANALALEFLGFDMSAYNGLSGEYQGGTSKTMFDDVEDFSTADAETILNAYKKALIVNCINASKSADDFESVIKDFEFEDVTYSEISDEELTEWINECIFEHKPYENYDDILKEYKTDNILYKINNARFSQIESLLETYASDLGITEDAVYVAYQDKATNGPLNEDIASRLSSKKPDTVEKLMKEIKSVMNPSSSSSGGGGNGGGGGGSSVIKPSSGNYESGKDSKPAIVVPVNKEPQAAEKVMFDDVDADFWGADAIRALVENEIIAGDGNGKFRPDDRVSREEFIKMVVSILGGINENAVCGFEDVNEGEWYYKYVATAVDAGIIYGVSDTLFGSGQGLTRQDMAVICERAFGDKIISVREDADFADEESIEKYAKEAVHKLYTSGVVNGVGDECFAPTAYATRAQAAQILYGLCYKK